MKYIYISIEVGGIQYEWNNFNDMLEYYKWINPNKWRWTYK